MLLIIMISPHDIQDISTVLMISPHGTHDIPHGTEHTLYRVIIAVYLSFPSERIELFHMPVKV